MRIELIIGLYALLWFSRWLNVKNPPVMQGDTETETESNLQGWAGGGGQFPSLPSEGLNPLTSKSSSTCKMVRFPSFV